jgi:hypothetical protein
MRGLDVKVLYQTLFSKKKTLPKRRGAREPQGKAENPGGCGGVRRRWCDEGREARDGGRSGSTAQQHPHHLSSKNVKNLDKGRQLS